ncbi:MAG: 50S ribosomal protein L4 [Paenibacillaceae bacterium]|jgi:large subunit ribosomal protein L4|nr:50S ribosomal protein L4 [Paenibacillaceae bacterium]
MPMVAVYNTSGAQVGEVELAAHAFGIEPNVHVLYDAVHMQQASLRLGTHKTKGRSEVRGGGRKPWKQKGTGRARQGSIRAPQWKGGGVVFGPTPRSYAYRLNKKVRRLALHSALSSKVRDQEITVLDALQLDAPRTKFIVQMIKNLNITRKALLVVHEADPNLFLSVRNIPYAKIVDAAGVNVLDLMQYEQLIITTAAADRVAEVFA